MSSRPPIFDRMTALADPIRCRQLLLLEQQELTVSELCSVLQLPQSTVSRHLKVLVDGEWVAARREGTSRRYGPRPEGLDGDARRLWTLVREEVAEGPAAGQDRGRLDEVLSLRRSRSQEFFSSAAGRWTQMRQELFGRHFDLLALPGLLDPRWKVADLGCGTGELAAQLAPFVAQVVAVDDSEAMLEAARARLAPHSGAEARFGRLESLPIGDGEMDAVTLMLVLHHLPEPARALREAARVLRPGGRLLIVDMLPHDREDYRQSMGHVWLGFGAEQLARYLEAAGFEGCRVCSLPPDPESLGPNLFAASAARAAVLPEGEPRQAAALEPSRA